MHSAEGAASVAEHSSPDLSPAQNGSSSAQSHDHYGTRPSLDDADDEDRASAVPLLNVSPVRSRDQSYWAYTDGDGAGPSTMGKRDEIDDNGKDSGAFEDEILENRDIAPIHHAGAVWESRDTYGPAGIQGLISSPYVATCAAFSALGGFTFGYDQGVVSVILVMPQFLARFTRIAATHSNSGFWKGLLTAMIELGAFIGALNQGWIADRISRRYSIIVAVVFFIIGSALQTGAVDYAMLTIARLIGGVGIGMLSMVAPLYISEISPPEIRGTLLVLEEFSIVSGIVVAFWITYGTQYIASEWSWRLPFLLQMVSGLILGVGILFLPFSPRWLVSVGREKEALQSLRRLRRVDVQDIRLQAEFWDIRTEARLQREVQRERHPKLFAAGGGREVVGAANQAKLELFSWMDLFGKKVWRRTFAGGGIMFFQQMVGINAIIYYAPTLFASFGLTRNLQLILTGVINVTQLVGVTTSIWSLDAIGRKTLLLVGAAAMCIAHVVIAGLVGKYSSDWPAHRAEGWISTGFLFFYMLAFGATWGPVPWAYPAEIFPSSLRSKGVALSTCSNWLNNFIVGLVTPPLVEHTGYGTYVFFAIWCLLAFVWTFFFIRETKGRTLEQMDHVFGDSAGSADADRRARIEQEMARESMDLRVDEL